MSFELGLESDVRSAIERVLSEPIKNDALFVQALTHKSFVQEHAERLAFNERLEFLGDAVLELVISDALFKMCPDSDEGFLTQSRASLVNRGSLAGVAEDLGLAEWMLLGRGEEQSEGRKKPALLANALEAFLGAVYLSQGWEKAKTLVEAMFQDRLDKIKDGVPLHNPKSQLQELSHVEFQSLPTYELIGTSGPDHDRRFNVSVLIEGKLRGQGQGRSKKEAEQEAALNALKALAGDKNV